MGIGHPEFLLYFRERNFLLYQEKQTLNIFLYFRKQLAKLKRRKTNTLKKHLIFWGTKHLSLNLKKPLIFQEELPKSEKQTKIRSGQTYYISPKKFSSHFLMVVEVAK